MHLTELIASLVDSRVIVIGSLPPHGRDLDLLARPREAAALAAGLEAHGFEPRGRVWARFRDCRVDVVELAPANAWGLPAAELDALFAQARPLESSERVCRPAPHHALLILARRTMREGAELLERRRERIDVELDEDRRAFEIARKRAPGWRASNSLIALEAAYRSAHPIQARVRRGAIIEELDGAGAWPSARISAWRAVLRRPRRGALIAFSGLDGSGKSTQTAALAETLERLGSDATVAWTSVASHPRWLYSFAQSVKRGLASITGGADRSSPAAEAVRGRGESGMPGGLDEPGKAIRDRSTVLTFAWSMIVTLWLAIEVSRAIWPAFLRGKVVICDRYELDTRVHLLYQYGESRSFRMQLAILRLISPRPRLAYLLEVSFETAFRRKRDYTVAQNARRGRLYRGSAEKLGVRIIDGERTADEICAEVAREAWHALS